MNRDEVFSKLVPILSKQLNVEPEKIFVTSQLSSDLGADSLDTAEIEMQIQEVFGCELDDEVKGIKTVNDIVDILLAQETTKKQ